MANPNIQNLTSTLPDTDFEVRSQDAMCINESELTHPGWYNLKYALVGLLFGVVFIKAEIVSWYRIQEMFRLESFHMYGVIGTAVAVGALSVFLIKKLSIKTIYGESIDFSPKKFSKGQIIGGLTFGFGWAMTGACPGRVTGGGPCRFGGTLSPPQTASGQLAEPELR